MIHRRPRSFGWEQNVDRRGRRTSDPIRHRKFPHEPSTLTSLLGRSHGTSCSGLRGGIDGPNATARCREGACCQPGPDAPANHERLSWKSRVPPRPNSANQSSACRALQPVASVTSGTSPERRETRTVAARESLPCTPVRFSYSAPGQVSARLRSLKVSPGVSGGCQSSESPRRERPAT